MARSNARSLMVIDRPRATQASPLRFAARRIRATQVSPLRKPPRWSRGGFRIASSTAMRARALRVPVRVLEHVVDRVVRRGVGDLLRFLLAGEVVGPDAADEVVLAVAAVERVVAGPAVHVVL